MLTVPPYLCTHRPSPSTAEFIFTTKPPQTVLLRILRLLLMLLRIALSLITIFLLHGRWAATQSPPLPSLSSTSPPSLSSSPATALASSSGLAAGDPTSQGFNVRQEDVSLPIVCLTYLYHVHEAYRRTHVASLLSRAACAVPLFALLPLAVLALYACSLRVHTSESLLVLRGLGVQTSASPRTYLSLGGGATRFIPTEKIRDIFVNEAFLGFEVRYYLVLVVEGEDEVVVVFPGLLPRRKIVEAVWRRARDCLYERRVDEKGAS